MADINSSPNSPADSSNTESVPRTVEVIEQLFFAYRDFVGEPDAILADLGFGRAHHRVLHFVYRNPGMTVAVLLDILQITKQSLSRVLKALIETGYIEQKEGDRDRRQRLLFTTDTGTALVEHLIAIQSTRIEGALAKLPPADRHHVSQFLRGLMNDPATPLDVHRAAAKAAVEPGR
ncbi:MAG: MarR family winged helix-turn-helix transcriptional regulator [Cohaesibacteraceae bacterium]